jgi:2-polyprenyl-3-methyl-5-hydroxy-6-metoxy-1,4-benzoquinol methylase
MLFRKSPEKFWNLIAKRYAASPIADRQAYETKIAKIKSYLSPEQVVLDIGCGTGTQCADLAGYVKQMTGIDIASKLLAIAQQRMAERKLANVDFLQTSLFDERLQPGSFDVVLAFFVLHLVDDLGAVLQRIHALLKPGGLFISETACLGEKNKIAGRLIRLGGHLGLIPKINLLTTDNIIHTLKQTGLSVVDKEKFSQRIDAEYTLFARKPG